MIEARKSAVFEFVFRSYNRLMLRKHFWKLHCAGLDTVEKLDRTKPIIFFGNHSSWWDGLIELFLSTDVLRVDSYLMMEERQMARYRFFRWLGVFSVNRDSAREAVRSLRYAASVFREPNTALWMYPQGLLQHNDTRPLVFYQGLARIAEMIGGTVQLVPVAHRYEFLLQQRPEVFTMLGEVQRMENVADHKKLTADLQSSLTCVLDTLRSRILDGELACFREILAGRASTNVMYDQARRRV